MLSTIHVYNSYGEISVPIENHHFYIQTALLLLFGMLRICEEFQMQVSVMTSEVHLQNLFWHYIVT